MYQKPTFSSVIKSRGFSFLWINQILMQLAINTLNFSLIIWVYKLTNSTFAVSAFILAVYLPAFIFGLVAGVFVDLVDKRKVIILLDLLFAGSFLLFSLILGSYPLILINAFFLNSLAQFFMPAESSSIPLLVDKKKLFVANALFSFTLYSCFMIGFTLAGPILNLYGIRAIFYLGGALLISAAILSLNLPKLRVKGSEKKLKQIKVFPLIALETRQTLNFIRGKLSVSVAIGLLAAIQGVIGVLAVVVPSYMERELKIHATDASLFLMLPLGLGMVVGALFVGRFFNHLPKRGLVVPAIILAGILLFGAGIAPDIAKALDATSIPQRIHHIRYFFNAPSLSSTFAIGAFFLGLTAVSIIIPSQTVLQEETSDNNRGKIFAVLAVFMNAFAVVPVLSAGVVADIFGTEAVFISLGILIFIIGILALHPSLVFKETTLPYTWREFLGLGHWNKDVS